MHKKIIFATALCISTYSGISYAEFCREFSPDYRVALVELYTSEGCSSCPPADEWFSKFVTKTSAKKAIGVSLHVPYWDNLGWKDRFADPRFEDRQRALAKTSEDDVYTPQFFVAGTSVGSNFMSNKLESAIAAQNALKPVVDLNLSRDVTSGETRMGWGNLQDVGNVKVVIMETSARTASNVTAGENVSRTIEHAEVVRYWEAVTIKGAKGEMTVYPPILSGEADEENGHIIAAAMNDQGKVLQAVSISRSCKATQ